eukprot:CAMPEP_0113633224 /NCGR_PEP_ID=MMETSP0017_2-20120614/17288_1 /TAXON_ID=2856 /ORGANISM="Cylindrotheca closterium" /LENGTH=638 /DNA_ID=CAMNT_0000543849 /DNA_START=62 /DNA_END=1978 /DNA_ORIENTATION=- /assembly_acc=CAM_ASM_000147
MTTIHTLFTTIIIGSYVIATTIASNIGQPIDEHFEYNAPIVGDETCSLISVVMDESGSMATEQDFMKNSAIPSIVTKLKEAGVDNVFVCIHGFGSSSHDPFGLDRGHLHGCTEGTLQGVLDSSLMDSWVTDGKYEDGWQAIHYAIRDLPSEINGKNLAQTCKTMGRNMILVTDEARYDNSCDGNLFQTEFKTDANGAEISWTLEDRESEVIAQDSGFLPDEVVRVTRCLEKDQNYKLLFEDSNLDGFCCDHGQGYIKVWYDDALIADSPARFQYRACVMMPPEAGQGLFEGRMLNVERQERQLESTNYFTLENTQQKLLDTGYRLTTITMLSMYGLGFFDTFPLGMTSDGIIFEADGNGSYTKNNRFATERPLDLLDPNRMALDYASISFETGGGAWLLHSLREGGLNTEAFAQAFADISSKDFEEDAFATYPPSVSPSLQHSGAPSTSSPSLQPSAIPSSSPTTSQPSEQPTSQPTVSTTEELTEVAPEGVFDDRIEAHEDETDSSRTIVAFATIGLICAVGAAFLASRKRAAKEEEAEEEDKEDDVIPMRQRADDTEAESLDDTEEPSSPLDDSDSSIRSDDDSRFALSGLANLLSSFRWDKDQDHMVDLSELAGEYGGDFHGTANTCDYDDGEYE